MKRVNLGFFASIFCLLSFSTVVSASTACETWTPDSRYKILSNGAEVLDLQTHLVWKRCPEGIYFNGQFCENKIKYFNFEQATAHASNEFGWRLPTLLELTSILSGEMYVENGKVLSRGCIKPAINLSAFPHDESFTFSGFFWTSTPRRANYMYVLDLYRGLEREMCNSRNCNARLRLVRDFNPATDE
ncbi:MAG TPA: hypothetical protein DCS87_00075 [Rheinheimera sp.]|nr:hypothetical protein [Rheinheimera sp.]